MPGPSYGVRVSPSTPVLGEALNFTSAMLRPLATMAVFRPGFFLGGPAAMSLRALLYRRPSEPSAIEIIFDRSIFLVRLRRHRQARRYTLRIDSATREVVLTIPPRGSLKEARDFAQKHGGWIAARLKRLPEAAPFAHGIEVPLRGVPHRIAHRRGERGTVWTETDQRADSFCASPANRRISIAASRFSQARSAPRPRSREPASRRQAWRWRSSAYRCATSRAAGARARTPACCRSPGG